MRIRFFIICFCILIFKSGIIAQYSSNQIFPDTLNPKRHKTLKYSTAGFLIASPLLMNEMWYKNYERSGFHFYNDNNEWLKMDKAGHIMAAYSLSRVSHAGLRWSGVDKKKAVWQSSIFSWSYMAMIEVLDGFSREWGFSAGDLLANTAGVGLFAFQQLAWKEQRILIKYSFHDTEYAQYRPDVLGSSKLKQIFKDYNGSTVWLSFNIKSFINDDSCFPKWLNLAVGYGAEGMTGGERNYTFYDGQSIPNFPRRSQFYLAIDLDLHRIDTDSKILYYLFQALSFIKIPLPTLEYNKTDGLKFHAIYF